MLDFITFLEPERDLATALAGHYDTGLVLLSVLISILSVFTAFLISERMQASKKRQYYTAWLLIGSIVLGGGIWAMHFIGMIAYKVPLVINYDVLTTFLSLMPAFVASFIVLRVHGTQEISILKWFGMSLAMGLGIGAMHYTGMAAMLMNGAMRYEFDMFILSLLVAVSLAGFSLKLKWWADGHVDENVTLSRRLLEASIMMGGAIAGMHYTGMSALYVFPDPMSYEHSLVWSSSALTQAVTYFILFIITLLIVGVHVSRQIDLYQRIKDSETRQRTILENMVDGVLIIDDGGIIISTNPAIFPLFGYRAEDVIGKNVNMIMPEPESSVHDDYLTRYRQTGQGNIIGISRDVEGLRKDGSTFPIGLAVSEMKMGGENCFLGIIRDISKRKISEEKLYEYSHNLETMVDDRTASMKLALEDAERANRAKSDFLSHMSHELRTPMNAILGFAQMLELDLEDFNETQRNNVEEILDAGRHLLNLINELLDLARIESGKMEISMEEVILDDIMHECLTLIGPQARERQIKVINEVSGKGYIIYADFTRYKQVLVNLLSNAVKYNKDHGEIALDATVIDGDRLRISVRDTGRGLSKKEISKLFSPFERLDSVYNVEGTGIGLVITKHLIGLMGGMIGVESVKEEGSVFWIETALFK